MTFVGRRCFLQTFVPGSRTIVRVASKRWLVCIESSIPSASFSSSPVFHRGSVVAEKQSQTTFAGRPAAAIPFEFSLNRFSVSTRKTSSKVSVAFSDKSAPSTSSNEKEFVDGLRRKTKAWLELPVDAWTQREVSRGRYFIREWSEVGSADSNGEISKERAVQQTKILRRWMKRLKNAQSKMDLKNPEGDNNNVDSEEMIETLNRCLDSWRKAATSTAAGRKHNPQSESMGLIHLFWDASESLHDTDLLPNRKTYSMCMNVLALFPESSTACDDVVSLLNQCRETAEPDLQFYNVCLHTLAKCATHHDEAPILVERIFGEMTASASDLSPNTACFVSVLHAWANSIPSPSGAARGHRQRSHRSANETGTSSLAAERAQTILNQMIRDYPQLVDTICFNICIDAWGKQGHPEKAEAILRRLHRYHRPSKGKHKDDSSLPEKTTVVRPNQISYNSAINAWSKSASFDGNGGHDPQHAADRAARLLRQMKAQGLEPTQETFGSLMESYSKTPNPGPRVQKLLDELENKYSEGEISLPPPKVSYLMAIRAWGRTKPGGAKKAESLVRRLEEVCSQQDSGWAKLQPCTILYTALVSAWAQSDGDFAPDRARDLFREMLQMAKSGRRNVAPNAVTLNAVLEAFCNQGRIDEAREFLANAKRVVRPDSKSYLTILKAYANSEASNAAEKAEEFLVGLEDEYHRGEGVTKPTIRMYSQVLVAWGNSMKPGATFRAEELFWKLLKQEIDGIDVVPDTTTLNCVLRAWSKSSEGGAAERAEALLQKVRDEHSDVISIDPISHLHLIYAWAHSRRRRAPKEAEKHLERARELCCSGNHSDSGLTRAHFNGTILAWKKSNHSNAACQIRKLQRERDQKTQNSKM